MDWTEGYYADLDYTSGYYHELGPAHLRFCCLLSGVHCEIPEAPTVLELGFGQGISINIHAAAGEGRFWGVDFNPAHVVHARELAAASGADLQLTDDSFAAFARRADLPMFDVIALHGVWSWVSDANRAVIIELARSRLKPGGVFYLSYNCQPGWAARSPVRHLLNLGHDHAARPADGPAAALDSALAFVEEVAAAEGRFFSDNRAAAAHAGKLAKNSRRYLGHEYLNTHWHVPYFSEVAATLGEAKLTFVSSARLLDRVNDLNLQPASVALLDRQKTPVLRESVRDYLVNQRFRPDIFIKGAVPMSATEQAERIDATAFVLACGLDEIDFRVTGALGEATLAEATYKPLVLGLEGDGYRPKSVAELANLPDLSAMRRADLVSALMVLAGMGAIRPARAPSPEVIARCESYNRLVLERAVSGRHLKHLAAPATEGGILSNRSAQLLLRAWLDGARDADSMAQETWSIFRKTNERVTRDDQELAGEGENLAVLTEMAGRFLRQTVPLYLALGILPAQN